MMNSLKSRVVMVGIFLLMFGVTNAKAESTYVGEFCWNITNSKGTYGPVKLGITHVAKNHYLVQGSMGEENLYLSGSGLVVGSKIVFSMTGTETLDGDEKPVKIAHTMEVTIDLATMNGTYWDISIEYWVSESTNNNYREGTWDYTSCQ